MPSAESSYIRGRENRQKSAPGGKEGKRRDRDGSKARSAQVRRGEKEKMERKKERRNERKKEKTIRKKYWIIKREKELKERKNKKRLGERNRVLLKFPFSLHRIPLLISRDLKLGPRLQCLHLQPSHNGTKLEKSAY